MKSPVLFCSHIGAKQFRLLTLLLLLKAAISKSIIKTLPGFAGDLPFVLETGYIGVGSLDEAQLFYYFTESERNPEYDPLVLWLTGGPGCSTLSGLIYQIGPFTFDFAESKGKLRPVLTVNPYSWTKVANIIFLDAPVGTGFSYSTTWEGYVTSDTISAAQTYEFLRKWLMNHPEFLDNPLYIGGDSYSGVVVPIVVQYISDGNHAGNHPAMNLMGYVEGNPFTDRKIDMNSRIPFAHGKTLISDEMYEAFKKDCKGEYLNPNKSNAPCMETIVKINESIGGLFDSHILEPKCKILKPSERDPSILSDDYINSMRRSLQIPELWCRLQNLRYSYLWANDEAVQEALHIRQGTKEYWERCNKSMAYTQNVESVVEYHRNFIKTAYRVLVYSGDQDLVITSVGTMQWIRSLNLTVGDAWHPWFVDGQVAGYAIRYMHNDVYDLTFATVKGAGHTAPEYKPRESLALIHRWFATYPL